MAISRKPLCIGVNGDITQLQAADTAYLSNIDPAASGAISVGAGTTCTSLNLGTHANCVTINLGTAAGVTGLNIGTNMVTDSVIAIGSSAITTHIYGNLQVDGTEIVSNTATMNGDVNIGDAAADVCTFGGSLVFSASGGKNGCINDDLPFKAAGGSTRTISVQDSLTTAAGTSLVLQAGAAGPTGVLAGGNVSLVPSAPNSTGLWGHTYIGAAGELDSTGAITAQTMYFDNGTSGEDKPGLRYNNTSDKWQYKNDGATWADIIPAGITAGTYEGQALLWVTGSSSYEPSSDLILALAASGDRLINPATSTTGAAKPMTVSGGASSFTGSTGGLLTLAGGAGALIGGNVVVNGGDGATDGNVVLGSANTVTTTFGAGTNGMQFTTATSTFAPIGTGVNVSNKLLGQFYIDAVQASANVTATNLNALTGGASTTLHTHPGVGTIVGTACPAGVIQFAAVGITTSGAAALVYPTDTLQDRTTAKTPYCIGLAAAAASSGNPVSILTTGTVATIAANWGSGSLPALASVGLPVFVDTANPGKFTVTAPNPLTDTDKYRTRVGYLLDAAGAVSIGIGEPVKL